MEMKGECDALLPWPFQKKITMMLLDQNNGEHMIDAFRADHESSSFQRPKNNMNVASGNPLFMPLNGLSNRTYVLKMAPCLSKLSWTKVDVMTSYRQFRIIAESYRTLYEDFRIEEMDRNG